MPELIDKSLLIAYLSAIKPESYVSAYGEAAVDVINHVETAVNAMHAIEPEVRRGRWECVNDDRGIFRCSACWDEWYLEAGTPTENNMYYCPTCGAKMSDDETKK